MRSNLILAILFIIGAIVLIRKKNDVQISVPPTSKSVIETKSPESQPAVNVSTQVIVSPKPPPADSKVLNLESPPKFDMNLLKPENKDRLKKMGEERFEQLLATQDMAKMALVSLGQCLHSEKSMMDSMLNSRGSNMKLPANYRSHMDEAARGAREACLALQKKIFEKYPALK